MKKQITIWLASLLTLLGVTACNTMQGMGQDIEAGGDAIENSAEKHKNY